MKFVKLSKKELQEITEFYKGVMATAHEGLFYREGKVIGEGIIEVVPESDDSLSKAAKIVEARGWADNMDIEEDRVIIEGSIEVKEEADSPTCHKLRGIISTIYGETKEGIIEVKETSCESVGDDHCEFEIKTKGF